MSRKALITGSPGAVFEAVSAELVRRGWEVGHAPYVPGARVEISWGVEALFHVGVRTPHHLEERQRVRISTAAVEAAGEAARKARVHRFVVISSAAVYGRPRNLPCHEGELKAPRTSAERIRWRAEQAAWRAFRKGAPLTVLRPTLTYGPSMSGGPLRALALVALFNSGKRRIPIIRRGPVTHVVHIDDLARAAVHVADYKDDRWVVGRAFNVGDDAPLPLAEHFAAALAAMGHTTGRVLPYSPRLVAALLWLLRHIPDRALFEPANRKLVEAWARLGQRFGVERTLAPRLDREALHWMSADHYYDTRRLSDLGWRPEFPISTVGLPETIRGLLERRLLPEGPARSPSSVLLPGR